MNPPWLIGAATLSVLIAAVHSVLGERRIFRHLRRAGQVVPTEGGTVLREFQVRILWGAWHGLSVFGLGLAGVLAWLAQPAAQAASAGRVEWCVALALGIDGPDRAAEQPRAAPGLVGTAGRGGAGAHGSIGARTHAAPCAGGAR
jgi:hypothetical protein